MRSLHARLFGLALLVVSSASCTLTDTEEPVQTASAGVGTANTADRPPFKIHWSVGTQSEDLALMSPDRPLLSRLESKVDGYFLNIRTTGNLAFWKTRPLKCTIRFAHLANLDELQPNEAPHRVLLDGKYYDASEAAECDRLREEYYRAEWVVAGRPDTFGAFARRFAEAGVSRAFKNLDLVAEKAAGKTVTGNLLLTNEDFEYRPPYKEGERLVFKQLPQPIAEAQAHGLFLDRVTVFQAPGWQAQNLTLLRIPLEVGGPTELVDGKCPFCLPNNARILGLVERSLDAVNQRVPKMMLNIPFWTAANEDDVRTALRTDAFAGVSFEGGQRRPDRVDDNAVGIVWLLKNTDARINLMVPSWTDGERTNTEAERDAAALENLSSYVRSLNFQLRVALGAGPMANPICNRRITITIGGVGTPLHPATLPLNRHDANGGYVRRAGTIAGQIFELSEVRANLCGS